MAVALDTTVGGASANSYASLADTNTFMESRLNASKWETDATTDDKNRALVEATRQLTRLRWRGNRADSTQDLSWPRQWALDPDSPVQDYYATDVVPQRVKDATMELAFQYVKAGTTDLNALDSSHNISRKRIDVLDTAYVEPWARAKGLSRYPSVLQHIRPLLINTNASRPTVRG